MDVNSFVIGYTKGKQSASGGEGGIAGFHMVRFFNDDRTTLLYTVFVPNGASAIYAGETPISTVDYVFTFEGFYPSAVNVTSDLDCYATYGSFETLNEATWEQISIISADGNGQNYFAVGDTKMIHIEGTVGTLAVNGDYGVYIIGFDHNSEIEGYGIHFGTFKSMVSNGVDLALISSSYNSSQTNGSKYFNMSHYNMNNYGGWAGCDLRYDILGSTDVAPSGYGSKATAGRVGYDPSPTCATKPKDKTLMAALPTDLLAVMKPMTKYTDNVGGHQNAEENVTASIDYLPLLASFEVFGKQASASQYEMSKQKQYDYFSAGNSTVKYKHSNNGDSCNWWLRSVYGLSSAEFCRAATETGAFGTYYSNGVLGLSPIFKV